MKSSATHSRAVIRQQWLERIDATARLQGMNAAGPLALQAIGEGVEHPAVMNMAAAALYGQGKFKQAKELLDRARKLSPRDPHILNSLGSCLQALGEAGAAIKAYSASIAADPDLAAAYFNRGSVKQDVQDLKGARADYERALALDPRYAEPAACLAWLEAQAGNNEDAREQGKRALALMPTNVTAKLALASAELQQRNLAAAAAWLNEMGPLEMLTPVNRSVALGLIADWHDAEERFADAFAFYKASNDQLRALHHANFEAPGTETALQRTRRLITWFDRAKPDDWQEAPVARPRAADPAVHVFLVGFPRSGTTLLENVLAAHPDVVSLEEKDSLEMVADGFLASDSGLERLARITPGEAATKREAYWTRVRQHGAEPRGKVFIDKMPMASAQLPVISKLFPGARILFARRDPRDVVWSCFRRRFGMNPAMYQLLTLESAADFYDATMQLSRRFRTLLPLPHHVVRYESLVDDFEGTSRTVCEFLGLDWDPEMTHFAEKARSRGIATPSAAQVARGLNRDGQGSWRRYARQMAPVLPILDEWVRAFGYEDVAAQQLPIT